MSARLKSIGRVLVTSVLLLGAGTSFADERVLIDHVPLGAEPAVVIAIVKQAFLGRHWIIESMDKSSVTASVQRELLSVRMRIYLLDDKLLYDGSSVRRVVGNPAQNRITSSPRSFPENWANNLRNDIGIALAPIPDRAPPPH